MTSRPVRVRFAPSPTGYLHVGGARTALYNQLFARHNEGQFILRVEDTDEERSTEEALRLQLKDLEWLGLQWDEGPHPETLEPMGDFGPYRQSQRKAIYRAQAEKLLQTGQAYYCFLTDEEIEAQKAQAKAQGRPHQVQSPWRDKPLSESLKLIEEGQKATVRFKVPETKVDYKLKDLVRGEISFPSDMVGDFVLIRSSGMPVYNFCCVVDDALMEITHVLRAEEHLSNTLRQIMIYQALGFEPPEFAHLSIILGEDRQKMSKRHGATSCNEFREQGYLPEALTNFIALLGWSSPEGKEILSHRQMVEQFSLDRVHSAPAVFDQAKLKWMNATYLRKLPEVELWKRLEPFFAEANLSFSADPEWRAKALGVFKTSMETLRDAIELFRPLSTSGFEISVEAKDVLAWDTSRSVVEEWKSLVGALPGSFMSEEDFVQIQEEVKTRAQVKGKHLFMPIRVAVIGQPSGAELKVLVPLLEKQTLLDRAEKALELC